VLRGWVRCSGGHSSTSAIEIATWPGPVTVQILAVMRHARLIGGGKWALRAPMREFAGVHPNVCLQVGLLDGLVSAVREWTCVHTDQESGLQEPSGV
jgi:hypothetical protein